MKHKEQMEFIHKFFNATLPRLGVGDDRSTRKALDILLSVKSEQFDKQGHAKPRVMDIGCGNGGQTIQLAKHTNGTILAVDNHQPYLDELQRRAETEGVSERIRPYLKDMCDLGSDDGSFELIWSEGALNLMGFREGLVMCHSLLVPGGLMAVSELSWLRSDPPGECRQFFNSVYPAMADIDANLSVIKKCGYEITGHFTIPESVWWNSYLHPLEDRLKSFRKEYATVSKWLEITNFIEEEIEQYRRFSDYYGNVFYLMQRDSS